MKDLVLTKKRDIAVKDIFAVQKCGTGLYLYLPTYIVKKYGIVKGDRITAVLNTLWEAKGVKP